MLFNPRFSPTEILAEHRLWNDRFARPLRPAHLSYLPDLTPDRRLRVGFVSPNFRNHVVGRFMLPFCNFHDHRAFEFYFYDDSKSGDAVTGQLRSSAEIWRQTAALSDDELSTAISQDRIDILVDLNMHMEGSRLLAFARKPAPVQVTYLAYAGTTGLGTMDYRLTDPFLDPPGDSDRLYSERSIRLAQSYWCYPPPDEAPTVGPLPVARSGHITFGCLNSFSKINPPVLELWAAILRRTPNSHLLLHAPEGTRRQEVRNRLAQHDISSERISFVPRSSGRDYFSQYLRIDIGLDPFPYPGGTTTCDALWMGVPVVTLAGQGAIARAGVSILNNVGLPHLIANSQPDYLQIATGIASDIPWLQTVRATLRPAMRGSPLMDPQRFTQDVEAAFKKMWMNYILDGDAPPQSGGEPTFPSSLSPADP
jgi:predicted O-linked N-acetylglucosamine transferase (SPINDLY family)